MAPSFDDGFELWHTGHRQRIADLHASARDSLQGAARHLAAARAALADARAEDSDYGCCVALDDHRHIAALLDAAQRDLAAASALTRPQPT